MQEGQSPTHLNKACLIYSQAVTLGFVRSRLYLRKVARPVANDLNQSHDFVRRPVDDCHDVVAKELASSLQRSQSYQ